MSASSMMPYQQIFWPGSSLVVFGKDVGATVSQIMQLGYPVHGWERSIENFEAAVQNDRLLEKHLELVDARKPVLYVPVDGMICANLFEQLQPHEVFSELLSIRELIKEFGRLVVPHQPDSDFSVEQFILLAQRVGFSCIEQHAQGLVFTKRAVAGQPLDRIESVLRNDRKSTSYKLALLRAFCDIAEQDEAAVRWHSNGQVGVSIARIAEHWLRYYWPLLVRDFPQIGGSQRLAFAPDLQLLIQQAEQEFHTSAMQPELLSLFLTSWGQQRLPTAMHNQMQLVLKKIRSAIVQGPVTFASGGEMFSYDKTNKQVVVNAELWREFCLTGYWVRDSLLVRWADLTCSFSGNNSSVNKAAVIACLFENQYIERNQAVARKHYVRQKNLHCVWTNSRLDGDKFDVDHMLPFSAWHLNDLWNLQPASKKANNQKRDKIPAPQLLVSNRDEIIENWRYLHTCEQPLFEFELERTLGGFHAQRWEIELFQHLMKRVESSVTARQMPTWQPS